MSEKIVELASVKKGDPEFTAVLQEITDRFARGEISEIVVITNDRVNNDFRTFGDWQDRWRMVGAIENAKMRTMFSD
jgi:hypothetical protein